MEFLQLPSLEMLLVPSGHVRQPQLSASGFIHSFIHSSIYSNKHLLCTYYVPDAVLIYSTALLLRRSFVIANPMR